MGVVSGARFDFNNTVVEYDLHKGTLQPVFFFFFFCISESLLSPCLLQFGTTATYVCVIATGYDCEKTKTAHCYGLILLSFTFLTAI